MNSRIPMTLITLSLALGLSVASPVGAQHEHDGAHHGPAMNFHRINPRLATSGHFTEDGVSVIAKQGVSLVIDLRDEPPTGQEQRLAAAGIRWINVPVVWAEPRHTDFEAFKRVMAEHKGESILVQCQANYRASAMTYLYRVTAEVVPELEARKDLNAIWTPEGTWQAFIDEILDSEGPKPAYE